MSKDKEKAEEKTTASIQASGFPLAAFKEWNESCEKDFGSCRWVKMMHDHQLSKVVPLFNSLIGRIEQLENHIQSLAAEPEVEEPEGEIVKTIGGTEK